jgi:predicted GTPase
MSDSASDSIPNFILFGEKFVLRKFLDIYAIKSKFQPSKVDSIALNINEESFNLDSLITQTRFVKNNKYLDCRFISINVTEEAKEFELICKVYNIFQSYKIVRVNGFIFLMDGGDLRMPFSIVENQLKSLKVFFDINELNKRIALCYLNFDDKYKLIYAYQKRILSSIFGENLIIEFSKMSNQSEDWDNFTDFVAANSSVSGPKTLDLNLHDSFLKIIKELSHQITVTGSLIKNLKDGKSPTKMDVPDSQKKLVNNSDLVNQNLKSFNTQNELSSPSFTQLTVSKLAGTNDKAIQENSFTVGNLKQAIDYKIGSVINSSSSSINQTLTSRELNVSSASHKKYVFLILGESGSGKSTFINYLANYFEGTRYFETAVKNPYEFKIAIPFDINWNTSMIERFRRKYTEIKTNNLHSSQTSECSEYEFKLNKNESIKFIDTPGFNDTKGNVQDAKNLEKIKEICFKNRYINGVILLINGSLSRKNLNMINCIESIFQLLPNKLRKDISLVLTNCQSELDCNFKSNDYFENTLKINDTYYMQNTFFKLEKNSLNKRQHRDLKANWEQSLSEIEKMLNKIVKLEPNSTESIMQIHDNEVILEQIIRVTLKEKVKNLFQSYFDLKCKEKAKKANHDTMISNLNHHKYETINAIPFDQGNSRLPRFSSNYSNKSSLHSTSGYDYPKVRRISVKLDDNEAKHKYNDAFNQNIKINNEINEFTQKEETKLLEMEQFVKEIEMNAHKLREINSRYNFATKFADDLLELKQFVDKKLREVPEIKSSFYRLENLVSKIFNLLM